MQANIFQFWDRAPPPEEVSRLMDTWRKNNKGFRYRAFSEDEAIREIRKNLGERAVVCFSKCRIPAMKADFFRYVAVFLYGGVYVDADTECLRKIDEYLVPKNCSGVFFSRLPDGTIANDFFAALKGSEILKRCIYACMKNIEEEAAGEVWHVTGPKVLNESVRWNMCHGEEKLFVPSRSVVKRYVGFHWDLEYKSKSSHWVGVSAFGGDT